MNRVEVLAIVAILISSGCAGWCFYVTCNADLLVAALLDMAEKRTESPLLREKIKWIIAVAERVDREKNDRFLEF